MEVIKFGPQDALFSGSMDVHMVGPGMLSSQNVLDHGPHHGSAMDAFFSERTRPWTSLWLGHGCSLLRAD